MKIKSFLLFCSIFILMSVSAFAQDKEIVTYTSGEWEYNENDTGITLTKYSGTDIDLVIPGELDGKTVTKLGNDLFLNNQSLQSVVMPNSIASMGNNDFSGCTALKKVDLSTSLKGIGNSAFRYCMSLETINIPMTVTSIGSNAFADCIKLTEINLLSVTSIGEAAFDNCQSLTNIILSNKLTTINARAFRDTPWLDAQTDEFVFAGKAVLIKYNGSDADVEIPYGTTMISGAFEENYRLESAVIPDTVKNIGQYAFREAVKLKTVNIPPYVTTIGQGAFEGCVGLETITLPADVKSIGDSAFKSCKGLKEFSVPSAVKNLPGGVFQDCSSLTNVIIPDTVTSISGSAFQNCPELNLQVPYGSAAEQFAQGKEIPYSCISQQNNDFLYLKDENGAVILRYIGPLLDVEVPAEIDGARVVEIGTAAFQNNKTIRRIKLPLTLKTIGDWAFSYMDALEYVQIPDNIESIGANVFTGDPLLAELRFPEKALSIGENPFDADTLTKICADEGSAAAERLQELGFAVLSRNDCAEDEETLALWAELNGLGILASGCDCSSQCGTEEPAAAAGEPSPKPAGITPAIPEEYSIISIPAGMTEVTPDLIGQAGKELILLVPASVQMIDSGILEERNVTIVASSGTYAEQFARENNVKFTVRIPTYPGLD